MITMILSVLSNFQYLLVVWYIIGIDHKKFSPFVIHVAHVMREEHRLQSKLPRCLLYELFRIPDYLDSLPLKDTTIHFYHNNNNSWLILYRLFYSSTPLLQAPLRHQSILSRYQVPINTSHQSLSHICDDVW